MTDEKKTQDFIKAMRSSATLLLRTLDRLQYEYSESSAADLRERVSLLTELDRLENKEAPIPMDYLRQRVRLLQAADKLEGHHWFWREMKNAALNKRLSLLKDLKTLEAEEGIADNTNEQIARRIRAIRKPTALNGSTGGKGVRLNTETVADEEDEEIVIGV
jgi:hypothetical protein